MQTPKEEYHYEFVRGVSACIITLGVMPLTANAELNRGREAYGRGEYVKAAAELSVPDTITAPRAKFLPGVMHANGQGVAQDRAKAIELFRQARAQGFAPADDALEALGEPRLGSGNGPAGTREQTHKHGDLVHAGPPHLASAEAARAPAPQTTPAPPAPARRASAAAVPQRPPAPRMNTGTVALQLGAFTAVGRAERGWNTIDKRAGSLTADLTVTFPSVAIGGPPSIE